MKIIPETRPAHYIR